MKNLCRDRKSCKRLIAILIVIIMGSSFVAALISSKGGTIKIESIMIDARGAELSADLYYPAGTSDQDKYPAVIVAPGAGCTKEHMRSFAEELAKRNFVVLNLNPYGSGLSETPKYNENDQGVDEYNIMATPMGVLDAVHFIRSLQFVDTTNIGLVGHSQGSRRTGYAALMDCGYYSFNDLMINLLQDTFGLQFTREEIDQDADLFAQNRLTTDGWNAYQKLRDEYRADYDSMVKSLCLIGSTAEYCNPTAVVEVGGYEVTRSLKVNECIINGTYDFGYNTFNNADTTKEAWYINTADTIENEAYYALNDVTMSSARVGVFREDTVENNTQLRAAIANRSIRMVMLTPETHSKNFFSPQTTARVCDYFNQTLNNNTDVVRTSGAETQFTYREIFNLIALLALISMIIPFTRLFQANDQGEILVPCQVEGAVPTKANKLAMVLTPALTVVFGFISIYLTNKNQFLITFNSSNALPLMITAWNPIALTIWLSAGSIIVIIVHMLCTRQGKNGLAFLKSNFTVGIRGILHSLMIAVAFIAVGYILLEISEYFFKQDFRFWMVALGQLKANHWMYVITYGLLMLPAFFILSLTINYLSDSTLGSNGGWKDLALTIVVNSVGIWLCCLINFIMAYGGLKTDDLFSTFILTYGTLLSVPINVFIIRKAYKMTHTVWLGSFLCSMINAWLLVSVSGMNGMYIPQTWVSNFLNI